MQIRTFTVIAFIVRESRVIRADHLQVNTTLTTDAPLEVIRTVSAHRARGRSVICMESGCIRKSYSYVTPHAADVLLRIDDADYIRLIRHSEPLRGLKREDFVGHVRRTFGI